MSDGFDLLRQYSGLSDQRNIGWTSWRVMSDVNIQPISKPKGVGGSITRSLRAAIISGEAWQGEGTGQFCTKPGVLMLPEGQPMLNDRIQFGVPQMMGTRGRLAWADPRDLTGCVLSLRPVWAGGS